MSKFSEVEIIAQMEGFVKHLAGRVASDTGDVLFTFDELVGELNEELVKGIRYYEKKGLAFDSDGTEQLKALLRRMMDNRIAELRHKYYGTHRVHAKFNISIEMELDIYEDGSLEETIPDESSPSPEDILLSLDRVNRTRAKLSPMAKTVFDACLKGNVRLDQLMLLSAIRAKTVGSKPKVARPAIVADALMEDERLVRRMFKEISNAYQEVCSE